MGRPKKEPKAKVTEIAPEPEAQTDAFVAREIDEPSPSKAERISLKLKDDGLVDWESHRGDTKEKIIKAFANDPEALKLIGMQSPLLPDGQGWSEENAKVALETLATVDAWIVSFVLKTALKMPLDPVVQAKAFKFTEPQLKEMAPRAARVANKYSSSAILKYQDEIALAGMFATYLGEQTKQAIGMQMFINAEKKKKEAIIQDMPPENFTPVKPVNGHDAAVPVDNG